MPQIIVTSDHGAAFGEGAVMFRERVTVADFESDHFAMQLVERLGWAVGDAHEVERIDEPVYDPGELVSDPSDPASDLTDPANDLTEPISDDAESIDDPAREADQRSVASVVTTASYTPAP